MCTQLHPTLCDPMHCSSPGSFVHCILPARMLEWAVISSFRGSFQPRDWTRISWVPCIASGLFYRWAIGEAPGLSLLNKKLFFKLSYPKLSFLSPFKHTHTYTHRASFKNKKSNYLKQKSIIIIIRDFFLKVRII